MNAWIRCDPGLDDEIRADSAATKSISAWACFATCRQHPILDCVRRADATSGGATTSPMSARRARGFNAAVEELVLGSRTAPALTARAHGAGAGRLWRGSSGAELIEPRPRRPRCSQRSTWGNHIPLLEARVCGSNATRTTAALHQLRSPPCSSVGPATAGDVSCCTPAAQPDGADLRLDQWRTHRGARAPPPGAILDLAYRGSARTCRPTWPPAPVAEKLPEVLIATSFSKTWPVPRAGRRLDRDRRQRCPRRRRQEPRAANRARHLLDAPDHGRPSPRASSRCGPARLLDRRTRGHARSHAGHAALLAAELCKVTGTTRSTSSADSMGCSPAGVLRTWSIAARSSPYLYAGASRMNPPDHAAECAYVASSIASARSALAQTA